MKPAKNILVEEQVKREDRNIRFAEVRTAYHATQTEFGALLGFEGNPQTVARRVRRFELGETDIDGPLWKLLSFLALAAGLE